MRIPLASDIHYTLPQLDWIDRVAPDHDVVVLAGDHLDVAASARPEVQAAAVPAHFGVAAQELAPVLGHAYRAGDARQDGRVVRLLDQHRELAQTGAGLVDEGQDDLAVADLELA